MVYFDPVGRTRAAAQTPSRALAPARGKGRPTLSAARPLLSTRGGPSPVLEKPSKPAARGALVLNTQQKSALPGGRGGAEGLPRSLALSPRPLLLAPHRSIYTKVFLRRRICGPRRGGSRERLRHGSRRGCPLSDPRHGGARVPGCPGARVPGCTRACVHGCTGARARG